MIKLFITDLDGTFLPPGALKLDDKVIAVLEKLNKKRIIFVVATGRALSTVPNVIRKNPFLSYIICSNGAKIFIAGDEKLIYKGTIAKSAVASVLSILRNPNIEIEVFVDDIPYVSKEFYYNNALFGRSERFLSYFKETRKPIDNIFDLVEKSENNIENINLIFDNDKLKSETLKELLKIANKKNEFEVSQSLNFNLEIGGKNVNKGEALKFVCKKENIDLKEVIASGDNINDLEMLEIAGISIAIENSPIIREVNSDYIVPEPEENGVINLLDKLL
ncbi:MAG: Cof-type HAD-IIB family hydrolase [Clostridiales Family XIII bacterium]|jgi:Cof subfamily protein (haloacid dehalogenase superfamily)|nr:Cof-type HAD-IIB family hydrolase [Clostridiales Family XIII bacterium]